MNWIITNKEWLFGGIGIAVPIALVTWFFYSKNRNIQKQKGGNNSTNLQAGNSINIGKNENNNE